MAVRSGTVNITAATVADIVQYGILAQQDGANVIVDGSANLNINLSGTGSQYGFFNTGSEAVRLSGSGDIDIRADSSPYNSTAPFHISIHALRAEGDVPCRQLHQG